MMTVEEVLKSLNIQYDIVEHKAVYTVEEAQFVSGLIDGVGCKNLFLKDKKKNYYLFLIKDEKLADLKHIKEIVSTSNISFGSEEELDKYLGLTKGSCTPFGIINDKEHVVTIIIDKDLIDKRLLFHPNRNTATISIDYKDLIRFIEHEGNKYIFC